MTRVSVVLPAYNEEEVLEETVEQLREELAGLDLEIVVVEDGCTDSTPEIAERLAERYADVVHVHEDERLGKGCALERGFDEASGDLLAFMDADLSAPPGQMEKLIRRLEDAEADVVVGSRYVEGSENERSVRRDLMSRAYNYFASTVLGTGIKDHQAGFKAMKRGVFESLETEVEAEGWFWDTEMIHDAKEEGYRVEEVPIEWSGEGGSKVNPIKVGPKLFAGVMRVKGRDVLGERYRSVAQYLRFATVGAFGAVFNTLILFGLTEFLGLYYMLSSVFAIEASIVTMFFVNNRVTFENTKEGFREVADGIARSNMVRSVGAAINLVLLYLLTELGLFYIFSNILAIAVASVANYFGERRFNWRE
ncbi:MAG: glycosyltransferase [Candidatus Nanohaloarchaea archaeon]|nr:glycosyltransferase [Candidatus Nanohaloarchaea archaeon]